MHLIKSYFEKICMISDHDWHYFVSRMQKHAFDKKQTLLSAGQTEKALWFVEKGIIRVLIPREENDITIDFAFPGEFISGYSSFITQTPSLYQLEALTPAVLWSISWNDLQMVYKNTAMGNLIGRTASENLFLKKAARELSLLTESAEQRYKNLLFQQPELIQSIPLKYLSSYIGITPQALSRIRKRIS